jgi:hypothetical protein
MERQIFKIIFGLKVSFEAFAVEKCWVIGFATEKVFEQFHSVFRPARLQDLKSEPIQS